MQANFEVLTESAESTAAEKTGPERGERGFNRPSEVNSLTPKTLWFQGTLAKTALPDRVLLPSAIGGGRGTVVELWSNPLCGGFQRLCAGRPARSRRCKSVAMKE
jgi:hypothetical protein